MYTCICGKQFERSQSYVAHCGHCSIHLGHPPKDRFGDSRAWSKGKTKETDERIKHMADNLVGRKGSFTGHKHTEEFKQRQAEIARYNASHHLNGWKAGSSKLPNKYEAFAETYLSSKNIPFEREVVVSKTVLSGLPQPSYYQLDFVVDGKINLELDGTSHNDVHDAKRDELVSKMYVVYRIKHKNSLDVLENELKKFILAFPAF